MIPLVNLTRQEEDVPQGTFSTIRINGVLFCWALEPPDWANATRISSIPAQQYECERWVSPKYGELFRVMNVPAREFIEFHPGNRVIDTAGCILLGDTLGKLRGDRAVLNSGRTFDAFMRMMQGFDRFKLTVREDF